MDVYIDRAVLLHGLTQAQGVADKGASHRLMAHVQLEVAGGKLTFTATNGALTLVNASDARPEAEGRCTVDAAKLYAVARLLDAAVVRLTWSERRNALTVKAGATEYKLLGTDGTDFPPIRQRDGGASLTIEGAALKRLIGETLCSISADDNRYGLNGAHLERVEAADGSSRLRMVTTDGSRLSLSEASLVGDLGRPKGTLIPRKTVVELKKLCDDGEGAWEVAFGERSASFTRGGLVFVSALVDGDFPDYRQVLPTSAKRRVTIERDPLVSCLKRVQLMAADRNNSVRFSFEEGRLLLSASDARAGDAREEVTVDLEGAPLATGFNVKYLLDILSNVRGERIQFDMGEALDPCLLRVPDRNDCLFVIMPMRLD